MNGQDKKSQKRKNQSIPPRTVRIQTNFVKDTCLTWRYSELQHEYVDLFQAFEATVHLKLLTSLLLESLLQTFRKFTARRGQFFITMQWLKWEFLWSFKDTYWSCTCKNQSQRYCKEYNLEIPFSICNLVGRLMRTIDGLYKVKFKKNIGACSFIFSRLYTPIFLHFILLSAVSKAWWTLDN